ncbi:MAG: hypothetical protein DRO88_03165 [Promethearchaeia archaeon]|nr:MAG: hypothetical protein DRO88_03165 [Candidatus Lokiarchaeia archaeon]
MTIYWAPFLHAYQPPWQDVGVLKEIYTECYDPLLSMLERHENAKITLNIQGCLIDLLNGLDLKNVRQRLTHLMQIDRINLVGSAKYHPILPIIPEKEAVRQISMNSKAIKASFDGNWSPTGFFPPEMAVSPIIVELVSELGFKWIIMDGIAHTGPWPQNFIQTQKYSREDGPEKEICTFFRDTILSNMISFKTIDANGFIKHLYSMFPDYKDHDYYLITAQDAETFGHHHKYYETSFLGKVFSLLEDQDNIKIIFISELCKLFPKRVQPKNAIRASTWSTEAADLASNVPYPLWVHPLNPVHKYQYRLLKALYKLMDLLDYYMPDYQELTNFIHYYKTARYFFDQSLHSCWLWWASMRPMWSPNLIYKGLDLVWKASLNAQLALINAKIGTGDEFYSIIIDNGERIMEEMIEQELAGQHVRTFGDISTI